jgi:hypothetical protein
MSLNSNPYVWNGAKLIVNGFPARMRKYREIWAQGMDMPVGVRLDDGASTLRTRFFSSSSSSFFVFLGGHNFGVQYFGAGICRRRGGGGVFHAGRNIFFMRNPGRQGRLLHQYCLSESHANELRFTLTCVTSVIFALHTSSYLWTSRKSRVFLHPVTYCSLERS